MLSPIFIPHLIYPLICTSRLFTGLAAPWSHPSGPPWSIEFSPNFSGSYWAQTPSGLTLGCQACSQIRSKWRPSDKQLPTLQLLSLFPCCFLCLECSLSVFSGQSQLKFHMLHHPFSFPKCTVIPLSSKLPGDLAPWHLITWDLSLLPSSLLWGARIPQSSLSAAQGWVCGSV